MAEILSKTFDLGAGAIHMQLKDSLGRVSHHTHYVIHPDSDIDAEMQSAHEMTDAAAEKIRAAFEAKGWKSGS